MKLALLAAICIVCPRVFLLQAQELVLDKDLHHLRIDGPREWTSFPEAPEADHLAIKFDAQSNSSSQTLRLRQQDVKQTWRVLLNEKELGRLRADEDDMVVYFPVPPATLVGGENVLRIEQDLRRRKAPDDVRVGEVILDDRTVDDVLADASVEIRIIDAETGRPTPARITVFNADGALQTPGAQSNDHLAIRPGFVFTSSGQAKFGLPAGTFTIYAGRGFEYSLAKETIQLAAGQSRRLAFSIRREVPTEGYVSSDTHIHTLTHSGHGDASVRERIVTLAAEGVELPIATDHNSHVDYNQLAHELRARQYFTPVIGNEVSTPTGHFNIFPVTAGATPPDHKSPEWQTTFDHIYRTPGVKVAILNHARDLHGETRPFGPKLYNAIVAENLEGWHMGFNAMEVINSGATRTDAMQLLRDWMRLLNRGRMITPVGSSDSHDVGRHFVGQGRTYIRSDDRDPGRLDVEQAVNNFLRGRVMVSYGLLAEVTVNGKYNSGELATTPGDEVKVAVRVLGPHWVEADRVRLFANGKVIREAAVDRADRNKLPLGVIWSGEWTLPKPKHDVHLVAIALGPGVSGLYWKTAKAYQPDSPDWESYVIGCSGAVWLDVDGDGRRTSAYEYARRLFEETAGDLSMLVERLARFDEAVASHAAHLVQSQHGSLGPGPVQQLLNGAAPAAKVGIQDYLGAWQESQSARAAH